MRIRRGVAPAGLLAAAACALGEVGAPRSEEQIVVQGVLNARATRQVLWIERTTPAGQPIALGLRPLEPPPALVQVRDQDGTVLPFARDTGNPARFVATFIPVHGRRYDLTVEAGERVVRAWATVPPPIVILDPPGDTISHHAGTDLRVSWASGTSRHVAVYVTSDTSDVSGFVFPTWFRDDTTAVIGFSPAGTGTRLVWVMAADSITARLFPFLGDDRAFHGNVIGGAGVFGAVTTDRLVVRVQ